MTEEDILLREAQNYYRRGGRQFEAIQLYLRLLEKYPNNITGWSELSAIQYAILDFDNSIKSSGKVLSLDPDNAWNIEIFLTHLKLLRNFKFEPPNLYLDEQTREAHEINELTGKFSLCEQIEKYSYKLISLYKDNFQKVYEINFSLAFTLIEFGKFQAGIECLEKAIELKEYRILKRRNPLPQIYNWMSTAYLGMKNYKTALDYLDLAFENGLDEFNYLKKADIYKELGDKKLHDQVIEDFITIVDKKIQTKPETAYILQKISALIQLDDIHRAELALDDFEILKPYDESTIELIEKQQKLIDSKKKP